MCCETLRTSPRHAAAQGVKHISVQSSVSLQHLPYDKDLEHELPAEIVDRLAFAKQKLGEIVAAAKAAPGVKPVPLTSALPTVGALLPHCYAGPMLLRMASRPAVVHPLLHDATSGGTQCDFAGAANGRSFCFGPWLAGDPKDEVAETLFNRAEVFAKRRGSQIQTVDFPTTSIGSFPQTAGAHAALWWLFFL